MKTIITLITCALLGGCANLEIGPEEALVLEVAAKRGVLEYIDSDPQKKQRVLEVVEPAKQFASQGEIDVVAIKDIIQKEVDFDGLEPEDEVLVDTLIEYIAAKLEAQSAELIEEEQRLQLLELFTWIEEAAQSVELNEQL